MLLLPTRLLVALVLVLGCCRASIEAASTPSSAIAWVEAAHSRVSTASFGSSSIVQISSRASRNLAATSATSPSVRCPFSLPVKYVVEEGDSLGFPAQRCGVNTSSAEVYTLFTPQEVDRWNNNHVQPDDEFCLPSRCWNITDRKPRKEDGSCPDNYPVEYAVAHGDPLGEIGMGCGVNISTQEVFSLITPQELVELEELQAKKGDTLCLPKNCSSLASVSTLSISSSKTIVNSFSPIRAGIQSLFRPGRTLSEESSIPAISPAMELSGIRAYDIRAEILSQYRDRYDPEDNYNWFVADPTAEWELTAIDNDTYKDGGYTIVKFEGFANLTQSVPRRGYVRTFGCYSPTTMRDNISDRTLFRFQPHSAPGVCIYPKPLDGSCTARYSVEYRFKQGDTLSYVAQACGVAYTEYPIFVPASLYSLFTQQELDKWNRSEVSPGQRFCLPSKCENITHPTPPQEAPPTEVLSTPPAAGNLGVASAASASGDSKASLSGGAIGGIVAGGLVGLALGVALTYWIYSKYTAVKSQDDSKNKILFQKYQKKGVARDGTLLASTSDRSFNTVDTISDKPDTKGSIELMAVMAGSNSMSGITAVPFSHVIQQSDVVHMADINLPEIRASPGATSFDNLPSKWRIPLSSVKVLCHNKRAIILGRGGYGVVYKAVVRKDYAAVKVVRGGGKDEQARLLHEITILEQCKCVNIVQFLGYSISEDGLLLCMEYMPGGTLWTALQDSNEFQWYNRGWQAMRAVAAGLYCLHEQNVAHLDLKTPSILVGSDRKVKIADLGLGKLVSEIETQASQLGTIAWTAPEVFMNGTCTLQSDVYSFSTIMWEVCTMRKPELGLRIDDIVVPEQAPQALVNLIYECRAENYWERPAIEEVCDRLASIPHTLRTARPS